MHIRLCNRFLGKHEVLMDVARKGSDFDVYVGTCNGTTEVDHLFYLFGRNK